MGRKQTIVLPNGEKVERVVKHTMLGNWSFATIRHNGEDYLVEKSGSNYKVKKQLAKRKR